MYHQICYLHIDVCGIHRNVSISFKNPQKHFNNNQTAKIANDPSVLPLAGPTSHRVRNCKFCPPLTKIHWAAKKDIWKRLSWILYLCCVASTTIKIALPACLCLSECFETCFSSKMDGLLLTSLPLCTVLSATVFHWPNKWPLARGLFSTEI